jgi:exosome complex component RRP41
MQHTIASAFESTLLLHLYPHSIITLNLHILSQDGSLLAACLNAATLALVDAGIPMTDYIAATTVATTASYADKEEEADPLLDLNGLEEQELPFLTIASNGSDDRICNLILETKVHMARLESMISVGLDGCSQIRGILDSVVRAHGKKLIEGKVG